MRVSSVRSIFWNPSPQILPLLWTRLESSPVGARLQHGAFWSLMGSFISRVLALASAVLEARIIGKISCGELGIIPLCLEEV
jgi:hypothetical protein